MTNSLTGLTTINVELTNKCNKACWMCGRRRIEKDYPELVARYADMDFSLVERIAKQLPAGIIVQLHNNGEPLMYPRFGDAAKQFQGCIRNIVTNGKLLMKKYDEIVGNLETVAVSIIENDPDADEQYVILEEFLAKKGKAQLPSVILRINGQVDVERYRKFDLPMAYRAIHSPFGSYGYKRADPTIPEIGICLDFLHHPAINVRGLVSTCVRFDPLGYGVLGDLTKGTLVDIWNSDKRREWLNFHIRQQRDRMPLCEQCAFWGVPTSMQRDADAEGKAQKDAAYWAEKS